QDGPHAAAADLAHQLVTPCLLEGTPSDGRTGSLDITQLDHGAKRGLHSIQWTVNRLWGRGVVSGRGVIGHRVRGRRRQAANGVGHYRTPCGGGADSAFGMFWVIVLPILQRSMVF